MKVLFIHQNFPGQYLHLAQHLRAKGGNEVFGIGEILNIKRRGTIYGITTIGYQPPQGASKQVHHYLQSTEAAIRRGQAVARSLLSLREKGFVPDVISAHPGWGEALFIRDVYPDVPILLFCEFFFKAGQADLSFDPEFPHSLDWQFSVRIRNTAQLISLPTANTLLSPTSWQASRYPLSLRRDIQIIHDGIDTAYMHPDEGQILTLQPLEKKGESQVTFPTVATKPQGDAVTGSTEGEPQGTSNGAKPVHKPSGAPITLRRGDKVVTYVARNLEPYRGFHVFMRALPALQQKHPDAHILIVGADGTSYSQALPDGETYKEKYLAELEGKLDLSKIHFLGRVPYVVLRAIFRISAAHVYLTYPFVLSWSMLEAMACECLIIGSDTQPVREVITHEENGLLTDFFDQNTLVNTLDTVLRSPKDFSEIRRSARKFILEHYELKSCLHRQAELLHALAANKYPNPS